MTAHFDEPIARWARNGAILGALTVVGSSMAVIVLANQSMDLLAVAALTALFGGAGFGAMLGGVLAALRVDTGS